MCVSLVSSWFCRSNQQQREPQQRAPPTVQQQPTHAHTPTHPSTHLLPLLRMMQPRIVILKDGVDTSQGEATATATAAAAVALAAGRFGCCRVALLMPMCVLVFHSPVQARASSSATSMHARPSRRSSRPRSDRAVRQQMHTQTHATGRSNADAAVAHWMPSNAMAMCMERGRRRGWMADTRCSCSCSIRPPGVRGADAALPPPCPPSLLCLLSLCAPSLQAWIS